MSRLYDAALQFDVWGWTSAGPNRRQGASVAYLSFSDATRLTYRASQLAIAAAAPWRPRNKPPRPAR